MNKKILVSGATGNTGGNTVKYLLSLNMNVRALVHKADRRAEVLTEYGVEVIAADLTNVDEIARAMRDVSTAFFLYPVTQPGILEAAAYFSQAAFENDVEHIVNLSQFGAHRHVKSHAAQNHWISERLFDQSRVSVTHLRPTLFAEWFLYQASAIQSQSKFFFRLETQNLRR